MIQQLQTYKHVSEERDPLVSVLVLNDVGQFLLDPTYGISENLQKDDIYIVKFSAIEPLLEQGCNVDLINPCSLSL